MVMSRPSTTFAAELLRNTVAAAGVLAAVMLATAIVQVMR
jgi:hypothetical protein